MLCFWVNSWSFIWSHFHLNPIIPHHGTLYPNQLLGKGRVEYDNDDDDDDDDDDGNDDDDDDDDIDDVDDKFSGSLIPRWIRSLFWDVWAFYQFSPTRSTVWSPHTTLSDDGDVDDDDGGGDTDFDYNDSIDDVEDDDDDKDDVNDNDVYGDAN